MIALKSTKKGVPSLAINILPGRREKDPHLCHLLLRLVHAQVIAISPLDDFGGRIAAVDAGVVDYLISPVNPLIIVAKVRNTLQRASQNTTRKEGIYSISR